MREALGPRLSSLLVLFDEVADAARVLFAMAPAFDGIRPPAGAPASLLRDGY